MFVGGPNARKDFHIEGGEEFFYQIEGDMTLKVFERGRHKDVVIKEGEVFLLPRAIPHSPQRHAHTVGLVVERERHALERDALRYFTELDGRLQEETLYEVWFQWRKHQMTDIMTQFWNSVQCKSGKPIPDDRVEETPITIDSDTKLEAPFSLTEWIETHREQIDSGDKLPLFSRPNQQMMVYVCGKGDTSDGSNVAQIWIWQLSGDSELVFDQQQKQQQQQTLSLNDSILVPIGRSFTLRQRAGSLALIIYQDPTNSPLFPKD